MSSVIALLKAGVVAFSLLALMTGAGSAQQQTELVIGYGQLKKDRTYGKSRTFAQYLLQPLGRPWEGSKVALEEVKWHGAEAAAPQALR